MKIKKLIAIYVNLLFLLLLTYYWINGGYQGILKENFSGGFQRFQIISCQSDLLPNCPKSYFSQIGSSVLLGDSEAMSISDEFKKRFGPHAYVYAESGCPFFPSGLGNDRLSNSCESQNSELLAEMNEQCRSNIYIFNRFVPQNAIEQNQYLQFILEVAHNCNNLVIVGTPLQMKNNFFCVFLAFFQN